jgi:hypothetical protein
MRNRFARACSVLAAGVAVTSVIGLSAASMASAATGPHARKGVSPNATPACGFNCFNLSSLVLGRRTIQNAYVPGDTGVGGKVGQKVNMNFASNSHPNEDFTGAQVGTLLNFCPNFGGTGLSQTSYVCINYPSNYPVFEANWSPFGNQSGLCSGAFQPVFSGENVTLQNCGTQTSTIWVGDLRNDTFHNGRLYIPWVNGASSNFSHPLVLTVDPGTQKPINQLKLQSLNKLTNGVAPDSQEFTFDFGPVNF